MAITQGPWLGALLGVFVWMGCSGEDPTSGTVGSGTGPMMPPSAGSGGTPVSGMGGAGGTTSDAGTGGTAGGPASGGNAGAAVGGNGGAAPVAIDPYALVDPACWDGQVYLTIPIPDERADISDQLPSFSVAMRNEWMIEVLNRRYPAGALFIEAATEDDPAGAGNCVGVAYESGGGQNAQETIESFRTVVHECGHMMELQFGKWVIHPDLIYECGSYGSWDGSPRRGVILEDEYEPLGPTGGILDFQEEVYLEGDSGNQDFIGLFTEYNQYINTLAVSWLYYDYAPDDVIAGDASRDFAWFLLRYLRILRAEHAAVYSQFEGDNCWRKLVLATWGKLNRYWVESRNEDTERLWTDESAIVDELIRHPELLSEIENLRVLDGCRE